MACYECDPPADNCIMMTRTNVYTPALIFKQTTQSKQKKIKHETVFIVGDMKKSRVFKFQFPINQSVQRVILNLTEDSVEFYDEIRYLSARKIH